MYNKANKFEYKLISIIVPIINIDKGYSIIPSENKLDVDGLIQHNRETRIKIELEFAEDYKKGKFLKRNKNNIIIPTYDNIHIPLRRWRYAINSPSGWYLRVAEFERIENITLQSLAYINICGNILELPKTEPEEAYDNKYHKDEIFIIDNLTTDYKGFCGTILKCLIYLRDNKKIPFLNNKKIREYQNNTRNKNNMRHGTMEDFF